MTKTFVKPHTYGRMGNFLFQAATAMAYAWRHNINFTLPNTTLNKKANPIYLQHLVDNSWNPHVASVTITEKGHAFQELPFQEEWLGKTIYLDGYWQSEKYFKNFRARVIQTMGYPWHPMPGFVSVHVRRGDYLRLKTKHPPVPISWIENAMAQFPGFHFVFYSDEIQWCKNHFGHRRDVTFSKGDNVVADLCGMANCEHHICSASTFSWWGAWLNQNPNKRVIMPKLWFVPGHGGLDVSDIVPTEWERI